MTNAQFEYCEFTKPTWEDLEHGIRSILERCLVFDGLPLRRVVAKTDFCSFFRIGFSKEINGLGKGILEQRDRGELFIERASDQFDPVKSAFLLKG